MIRTKIAVPAFTHQGQNIVAAKIEFNDFKKNETHRVLFYTLLNDKGKDASQQEGTAIEIKRAMDLFTDEGEVNAETTGQFIYDLYNNELPAEADDVEEPETKAPVKKAAPKKAAAKKSKK